MIECLDPRCKVGNLQLEIVDYPPGIVLLISQINATERRRSEDVVFLGYDGQVGQDCSS